MQRDKAIDAVRGFAILLVMIGHCIVLNGLQSSDPYLYDVIKSVQMPLFMTVSGVLSGMALSRGKKTDFRVIRKRAVSYLVPFFSWFVVVFLVTHIADGTISLALFGRELYELLMQTDKGLWFLMTLFVIMLVVSLSQMLADRLVTKCDGDGSMEGGGKRALLLLIITGCFYVLFFVQGRSGFLFLSPSLTLQYMPYYVVGYLLYGYGQELMGNLPLEKRKLCDSLLWTLWGISAISFLFLVIRYDLAKAPDGAGELLLQMMASLLGTFVCYFGMYRLAKKRELRVFSFLGIYTLEIYVLHFRFARLLPFALFGEGKPSLYSARGIFYTICVFFVMSGCTALGIWLIQKSRLLTFLLFGKRRAPQSAAAQRRRQSHTSSDTNIE